MINKKGQSLITFIIFLPVLLIIFGGVIELAIIGYNKVKITSVTKTIIAKAIEDVKKDDIIELYNKNDIEIKDLSIDTSLGLKIDLSSEIDSFLGEVIAIDKYEIKVNIRGYKKDNKIYYEKG